MAARRIDPDSLLNAHEVAELLGLEQARTVYTYRARHPDFPAPVVDKSGCKLWARADVVAWRRRHPGRSE